MGHRNTRQRTHALAALGWAACAMWVILAWGALAQAQDTRACLSPRTAATTFLEGVEREPPNFNKAARCFDFTGFEGDRAAQQRIPLQLKELLDARGAALDPEQLPAAPDHTDAETKQARVVLFAGRFGRGLVLERDADKAWRFSPETVRRIPVLHDKTFALGVQKLASHLPVELHASALGVRLWQLLALLAILALAWALGRLIAAAFSRTVRSVLTRAKLGWLAETLTSSDRALRLLAAAGIVLPILPELLLPAGLTLILSLAAQVSITCALLVIAWRAMDDFTGYLQTKAATTETRLDDQLIPLLRKTLKFVLVVLATLFILQNMDVDVGSLLAGLGLGGLAFALAAKDTLANMFGSAMIFADRPFQIGDWVKIGDIEGTVEEVGFRSTRVRTFYKSLVTVPNSTVANSVIDNLGARTFRRMKMTLGLTYDTTPDQMRAFVEAVRGALAANPAVQQDAYEVYFNNLSTSSLDVMVYCFLDVPAWSDELRHRQSLLLEFMRIADALGVAFAFPTQTIHRIPEPAPSSPTNDPPSPQELANIAASFGPGGSRSQVEKPHLTPTGFLAGEGSERGNNDDDG